MSKKKFTQINATEAVNEYIDKRDWRIKGNSNGGYSMAGLVNNLAGKVIANWWLDEVYTEKEGAAHRNGDYHIHDLDGLCPYCFTSDTKVKTVEYGNISIAELLEKNIKDFTVISYKDGKSIECKAHDLRCTRKNAELVEVVFDDGLKVRCTPDHKFLALTPLTNAGTFEMAWMPAAFLTMKTLRKAYTCDVIKSDVIRLEEIEGVITESDAKNSFAKVISVNHLDYKEDVYCMTVDDTHCFALENGVIAHNCCGHDLQKLLQEGFNGVVSRVAAKPPKHFREALYQMANYLGILQAEWAGAQAFSSFDTLLAPYVFFDMNVEGLTERDIKKAIINFVYNLNVPSRWGQSSFTNVTIDWTVPSTLKDLVPMYNDTPYFVHVWETSVKEKYEKDKKNRGMFGPGDSREIEFIDKVRERLNDYESDEEMLMYSLTYKCFQPEMDIINRCFYQVLTEGDKDGQPFTFPIPTVNITEDFDWDNPNCKYLFENTAKYGHSYFQNFIGSQYIRDENGELTIKDPSAYSPNDVRSMAFLPTQDVIYRDANGRVSKNALRHLVKIWKKAPDNKKPKYEFLINGEFKSISEMFEIDYSDYNAIVNIELENGYLQGFSMDHKCVVLNENNEYITKLSQDVKPGDRFIFSRKPWNINNNIGTYEAGKIVGYYIAEGHFNKEEANRVMFAININRNDIVNDIISFFTKLGCEVKVDTRENVNIHNVTVYGVAGPAFLSQFVRGNKAKTKRLNAIVWNTSDDFRRGIYDGYLSTDGCLKAKNFAHTPNKELCNDFMILASSIGKIFSYKVKKDNYHYFKPDKSDLEYFTSYKLDLRDFETFDDYYVIPVKNVNLIKTSRTKTVYNFTIDTDKHWVELPNGLVSHQCCRLQLDKKVLRKRGGGLFGSDAQTGSIGVVTINMARLGYLYKGDMVGLKARLKELCDMASSTLEKKREVVKKYNEEGLYPYTRRYLKSFDTFFSTIGVNGINEMIRNFTNDEYDIIDPRGQQMAKDLLDYMNELILGYQEKTGTLYNLEAVPAEGTTYRFAKEDKRRFGDKTKTYIECDKHGRVEIECADDIEYIECPLCREENNA